MIISDERYKELLVEEMCLQALNNAGVDNWGGGEWAIKDFIYNYAINHPDFIENLREYPNEPFDNILQDITLSMIADYELDIKD